MRPLHLSTVCIAVLSISFKISLVSAAGCKPLSTTEKEACLTGSTSTENTDLDDVNWFQLCVVQYYCLQRPAEVKPEDFKKPQFEAELKNPKSLAYTYFENAALRIESFFLRNSDWKETKSVKTYRNTETGECSKLLTITEARYLYVTYVLFIQSEEKLIPCTKDKAKKIIVPDEVCFRTPYGSDTCTSDYDVGLVGHSSGQLTSAFNEYFKAKFNGKPSEEVFDTNVYAYTLEYAMPELFTGMTTYFAKIVPYLDLKPWYQMQELASAYFKMYKFRDVFYKELKDDAIKNLGGTKSMKSVPDRKRYFKTWIDKLEGWDQKKKTVKNGADLRSEHNDIYGDLVRDVKNYFDSDRYTEIVTYMSEMAVALLYAAEAYHTRGAIRHVVGALQMKEEVIRKSTTIMDYWVSMIENWADSNKEYDHCTELNVEGCLLKMCKYLYRTFHAMKNIHRMLTTFIVPKNALQSAKLRPVYPPGDNGIDPETVLKEWDSAYRGKYDIIPGEFAKSIQPFLISVGCKSQTANMALSFDCLKSIQKVIMSYNNLLVAATTIYSEHVQNIFTLMSTGEQKSKKNK